MTKSDGSRYEAPSAMRLSDSPVGFGKFCAVGSNASGSCASDGASAYSCDVGHGATVDCASSGMTARGCHTGTGASGVCTTAGNSAGSL
jgi:hypothetical protein